MPQQLFIKIYRSQVQWHVPTVSTIWEAEAGDHLSPGVQVQPRQYSETLSPKNKTPNTFIEPLLVLYTSKIA